MPKSSINTGDKGGGGGQLQRVEGTGAIAPGDHSPGLKILHRTTSGIKLNGTIVVRSKLAYKNEILNKVW